ncbi:uncharacterized protein LOC103887425 isoform X2 [Papio anubis]|uniref:uncharacterized protein LOC103887425 isoform X2 n=1 Tax=Papio anubis TaxID=9555 RepID=UPI0012AE1453|nr:uncharacterized protein LOC103887425 isoform X2 [Papio anubis]
MIIRAKLREVSLGPYSVGVIDRILKLLYFSGSHSPGNPGPVKASEGIPATGKFLKERSLLLTVEAEKSKVKAGSMGLAATVIMNFRLCPRVISL